MGVLANPFKADYTTAEGLGVSEHVMFWHHLGPARKMIESIRPIDLEIAETVKDGDTMWFWKLDLPDVTAGLNRLRNLAIEDEAGYTFNSAFSLFRGLEQQKEANEASGLPFMEQEALNDAVDRVEHYRMLEEVVPSVQAALNEQFGDPSKLSHLGLEVANKKWESDPMALLPQLLYDASAEGEKSSNIQRAEYDAKEKTLIVTFSSGSAYRYFDVPKEVAHGLRSAKSKGSYFDLNVKRGGFKFERFG